MKIKLLKVAERILSSMQSTLTCLGMVVFINLMVNLFYKNELDLVKYGGLLTFACVLLTICLTKGYLYVRYLLLDSLGNELEEHENKESEELYNHLEVK